MRGARGSPTPSISSLNRYGDQMATRQNEYVKRRWQQLIDDSGGACAQCHATQDTKPLEFAHLEPTGLNGRSRGKSRRLFNILKHPDKYVLLCVDCHDDLDGMNRFRQQDYLSHH